MSGGQMFAHPPVHELVRPWSLANAYNVRPDAFTRMVPRLVLAVCTVAADAAVVVVLAGAVVVVADEDPDVVVVARSADARASESSPPPPHAANPTASARAVTARPIRRFMAAPRSGSGSAGDGQDTDEAAAGIAPTAACLTGGCGRKGRSVADEPRVAVPTLEQDRWLSPLASFVLGSCFALLDALTTWYALSFTHLLEGNPAARWAFDTFGLGPALVLRVLLGCAALALLAWGVTARLPRHERLFNRGCQLLLAGALVIWGMVAVSNMLQILYVHVRWG
jgi:hypothetical protein